jgi:hypothetical protein
MKEFLKHGDAVIELIAENEFYTDAEMQAFETTFIKKFKPTLNVQKVGRPVLPKRIPNIQPLPTRPRKTVNITESVVSSGQAFRICWTEASGDYQRKQFKYSPKSREKKYAEALAFKTALEARLNGDP